MRQQRLHIYNITYKDQRRKEREEKEKKKLLQRKEAKSKEAINGMRALQYCNQNKEKRDVGSEFKLITTQHHNPCEV